MVECRSLRPAGETEVRAGWYCKICLNHLVPFADRDAIDGTLTLAEYQRRNFSAATRTAGLAEKPYLYVASPYSFVGDEDESVTGKRVIDLIIIPPYRAWRWTRNPDKVLERLVSKFYDPPIEANPFYYERARYLKALPYRNTHLGEALIEGVVFCEGGEFEVDDGYPDRWTYTEPDWEVFISPYAGDDPPPPKYDCGLYNYTLRIARVYLRLIRIRDSGVIPRGRVDKANGEREQRGSQSYMDSTDPQELHEWVISDGVYAINIV